MSSFPKTFPANQEELDGKSLDLYDQSGKKILVRNRGFSWNEDLILCRWVGYGSPPVREDRDAWWIVKGDTCSVSFDQDELMNLPFGTVLESKNILEVFHWLVEQHCPVGKMWTKTGNTGHGSVSFGRQDTTPETVEELLELVIVNEGKTVKLGHNFDSEEIKKFESHKIPVDGREIHGVLVPHPAGGDLLVYMWYSDYDDTWRASTKRPRLKSKNATATVGSKLFDRLHGTMREASDIARGLPNVYGITTCIWVCGRDFPKKFHELVRALKFLRDHKGWGKNLKRLRKPIKDLLSSVESRMAIRRQIKEEEKFLCSLVGVKLKPLKERTTAEFMTEFKAEFVSKPA